MVVMEVAKCSKGLERSVCVDRDACVWPHKSVTHGSALFWKLRPLSSTTHVAQKSEKK